MRATKKLSADKASKIIAMPNLFNETIDILLDAQYYFTRNAEEDQLQLDCVERMVYSSEMSRITLRLSTVMAWLLARRALHAGQLTMQEVRKHYALQFSEICNVDGMFLSHALPEYMLDLHKKSLELYRRVLALDYVEVQAHSA